MISVYFIDHVLYGHFVEASSDLPSEKVEVASYDMATKELAAILGVMHAAPIFLINHLQVAKNWFGVGGAARKALQVSLLRQYMDYTDASRKRIGHTGFIQAILRDSTEVVDNGYMKLLDVARSAGMIACLIVWTASRVPASAPVMIIPLAICFYRLYRAERTALILRLKYFKAQGNMLALAEDVISNLNLVRDYQRRPIMAKRMQTRVDDVNYFANAVSAHTTAAKVVVPATTMCMVGAMIAFAPWLVGAMGVSAGFFIAVLNALQTIGQEAEDLFSALIHVQLSLSALLKISMYMNLDTDLPERMLANRKQRARGRKVAESRSRPIARHTRQPDVAADADGPNQKSFVTEPSASSNNAEGGVVTGIRFAADEMNLEVINVGLWQRSNGSIFSEEDERRDSTGLSTAPTASRTICDSDVRDSTFAQRIGVARYDGDADDTIYSPLQNVHLTLQQGKIYAIVGRHSSGKSSLLRMLGKSVFPTRCTATFCCLLPAALDLWPCCCHRLRGLSPPSLINLL